MDGLVLVTLGLLPLVVYACLQADPSPLLHLWAKMLRSKRRALIEEAGEPLARWEEHKIRELAKAQGYDLDRLEPVIRHHHQARVEEHGKRIAAQILGAPTMIEERY